MAAPPRVLVDRPAEVREWVDRACYIMTVEDASIFLLETLAALQVKSFRQEFRRQSGHTTFAVWLQHNAELVSVPGPFELIVNCWGLLLAVPDDCREDLTNALSELIPVLLEGCRTRAEGEVSMAPSLLCALLHAAPKHLDVMRQMAFRTDGLLESLDTDARAGARGAWARWLLKLLPTPGGLTKAARAPKEEEKAASTTDKTEEEQNNEG